LAGYKESWLLDEDEEDEFVVCGREGGGVGVGESDITMTSEGNPFL